MRPAVTNGNLDAGGMSPHFAKTAKVGQPLRPWPDEILMDEKTKALVDKKWKDLGIE
jgi:hypothetical protein